ncbi:glycosyltransferase family 4 protein [Alteromonas macleodii]|uniref:glycosyltransferase family 4 protein n=1 Tax=Alteromonas macleodii TaxID=28108 RepID=UPI000C372976|nr:hypothetical protein [Halomonas sp.]|tara:strand:+ start:576 stop:1742 length:1167 start_codon:yes stop_codon:yes gene_type:complete
MKVIAIDARFLARKQRGMPAYVSKLCTSIPSLMPDVKFVLLVNEKFEHNDVKENYLPRLQAVSQPNNVEVVNIDAEDERSWEIFKLPSFLRQRKIDLLHMPTNRVCMFTNTRQISTVHDCMEWKYLDINHSIPENVDLKTKFYHWRKRFYSKLNYLYGVKYKAAQIITVSHYAKASINQIFGVKSKNILVCRHGLPEGFEKANGSPISERNGVLMLGGESHQKNCVNAIAAYANLEVDLRKKHRLTICSASDSADSKIKKALVDHGVENDVEVLSWVSTERLINLFETKRAFLFVSREEGFGFPLLQALHCGTPTVISKADVLREIAGETYPYAETENHQQMTSILSRYLTDDSYWHKISQKSLVAASPFTWEESIQSHIRAYRELIK